MQKAALIGSWGFPYSEAQEATATSLVNSGLLDDYYCVSGGANSADKWWEKSGLVSDVILPGDWGDYAVSIARDCHPNWPKDPNKNKYLVRNAVIAMGGLDVPDSPVDLVVALMGPKPGGTNHCVRCCLVLGARSILVMPDGTVRQGYLRGRSS